LNMSMATPKIMPAIGRAAGRRVPASAVSGCVKAVPTLR